MSDGLPWVFDAARGTRLVYQSLEKPESIRQRDAASFRPGDGLKIVGNEQAQKRFARMVQREMRRSPAFHELMLRINADKAHPITVTLGSNEPKAYVDRLP